MDLSKTEELRLPACFDAHVHLRDGEMAELVTPTVRQGGVNMCYVMVSRVELFFRCLVCLGFKFGMVIRFEMFDA